MQLSLFCTKYETKANFVFLDMMQTFTGMSLLYISWFGVYNSIEIFYNIWSLYDKNLIILVEIVPIFHYRRLQPVILN